MLTKFAYKFSKNHPNKGSLPAVYSPFSFDLGIVMKMRQQVEVCDYKGKGATNMRKRALSDLRDYLNEQRRLARDHKHLEVMKKVQVSEKI